MAEALKRSSSSARAEYLSSCLAAAGGWEGRGSATRGLVTATTRGLEGLVGPELGLGWGAGGLGSGIGLGLVMVSVFETSMLHLEKLSARLTRSQLDLVKVPVTLVTLVSSGTLDCGGTLGTLDCGGTHGTQGTQVLRSSVKSSVPRRRQGSEGSSGGREDRGHRKGLVGRGRAESAVAWKGLEEGEGA